MKMQHSTGLKIILGILAILLLLPGAMALFNPEYFAGRNGVDITGNLSLYNDYRGIGGLLLGAAVVVILGIIHERMAFTSVVVAILTYLALGLGRLLSILADGMPADGLFKATIAEMVLGGLAIFALVKFRDKSKA